MPAIIPGTAPYKFLETFRQAFADTTSRVLASEWKFAIDATDDGAAPPATPTLCFQLSFSGGLQGDLAILLRGTDALLVAQKLLSEPADASAKPNQNHKAAVETFLQQVVELAATRLKNNFGDIKFAFSSVAAPPKNGIPSALLASESSTAAFPLKLWLSSELFANLSAVPSAAQAQTGVIQKENMATANGPNFDLLLDVNLNLTLRFGQCIMSLREILDMNSGSVIELDREVNEPADLLIGDKLIARGEVVIVDGNYGIRVTEVADVRERLETL